jgi:hypothetical protein
MIMNPFRFTLASQVSALPSGKLGIAHFWSTDMQPNHLLQRYVPWFLNLFKLFPGRRTFLSLSIKSSIILC